MRDLDVRLSSAIWRRLEGGGRSFVRHREPGGSPGLVWQEGPRDRPLRLTVVIPTVDAWRGGYFPQLLAQIGAQLMQDYEIIAVRGDPRQGRAINVGADLALGRYLVTLDDDTSLPDPEAFGRLLAVMEAHPDIGLAGGNNVVPAEASSFIRRAMTEIPRRSWEPVQTITDSDLAEHPCLMARTAEFKEVGGENELIARGLDPYLRDAFRKAGKRVVVVPHVIYHHLPPESWGKLLRQYYRNGKQAAFVNRHYPQWVMETPSEHGAFDLYMPFRRRAVRYLGDLFASLWARHWIWLGCQVSYMAGFLSGWMPAGRTGGGGRNAA